MTRSLASLAACTLLCACEPAAIALLGAGAVASSAPADARPAKLVEN